MGDNSLYIHNLEVNNKQQQEKINELEEQIENLKIHIDKLHKQLSSVDFSLLTALNTYIDNRIEEKLNNDCNPCYFCRNYEEINPT